MLFSGKDLRKIIIPLMVEQVLAITIGMIDTIMVSSAGEAAVSGVSLVDALNLLLIYLFSALSGGGAVIVSQLMGAKDRVQAREASKQLIWIVFLASTAICLTCALWRHGLLDLIYGGLAQDVMDSARVYFLYTALSLPFYGVFSACSSVFRAEGNSKISLYCSIGMNLINVGGNAWLILGLHMGAEGAAIATLVSRVVGAAVMLILIGRKGHELYVEKLAVFRPQWKMIKRICYVGVPNGVENSMFQFGKVVTQSIVSGFATAQIAANAVANAMAPMQYTLGSAVGLAMIVVVGRCIGAKEEKQAIFYTKKLMVIAYAAILAVVAVMWVLSHALVGAYDLSTEAAPLARELLVFHGICCATVWPVGFVLPSAFRAAGDVRFSMVLAIASMWIFRVGLGYLFGCVMQMGVMGVWLAMACDWTFRAVIFTIRFYRKKWLGRQVI